MANSLPLIKSQLEHLSDSDFPNLRLLMLHLEEHCGDLEINNLAFLERMELLTVLSLKNISIELPPQTRLLKNLRTLLLVECGLRSISLVGELLKLEVLNCYGCAEIEELPVVIGRLRHLKLLDLSFCYKLKRVVPGIISSLVELEELKMLGSFDKWESAKANNEERINASIEELVSLSKLSCLEIQIEDVDLLVEARCLCQSTVTNKIFITGEEVVVPDGLTGEIHLEAGDGSTNSNLSQVQFCGMRNYNVTNIWCRHFSPHSFETLQELWIYECDLIHSLFSSSMSASLVNLRFLDIRRCKSLEKVIVDDDGRRGSSILFPSLEKLILIDLSSLRVFCDWNFTFELPLLEEITITRCPKLEVLTPAFPNMPKLKRIKINDMKEVKIYLCHSLLNLLETAKDGILQSELLVISQCQMMEEVFRYKSDEQDGMERHIVFPKLDKLIRLYRMPSLSTFARGIESLAFPLLQELSIYDCPDLKTMISPISPIDSNQSGVNGDNHDDKSIHLFCNQKVEFGGLKVLEIGRYHNVSNLWCRQISPGLFSKLERLWIYECDDIRTLLPSSVAELLGCLKSLDIRSCKKIEKVVSNEKEISGNAFFQSLVVLRLEDLPLLATFCERECELPLLEEIYVDMCPNKESFIPTLKSSAPKWRILQVGKHFTKVNSNGMERQSDFLHQNKYKKESTFSAATEHGESSNSNSEIVEEHN